MEVTFPFLAGFRSSSFRLVGMSLDAQQSISGVETATPTMRGRWTASCEFVFHGEGRFLQWQAFLAQMEGRVGTTLVPCNEWFRPKDRDGHALAFADVATLDRAQTWEHFGFSNTDIDRVTVAAGAPLRATQIDVTLGDTTGLRPGQKFTIGERLYWVQSHWQPSPDVHRLMFLPPLRSAVAAGTRVEIEKPVCRMRLTTEDEGQFSHSYDGFAPIVTVNFQEAI